MNKLSWYGRRTIFISLLICIPIVLTVPGPICFSCDDVLKPRGCAFVSQCSENQVCIVQEKTRTTGRTYYSVGCADKQECITQRSSAVNCTHCCSYNFCNNVGCREEGYPPRSTRGPVCFHCNQQLNPDGCDSIALCSSGESCIVERKFVLFDKIYSSHCVPTQNCVNISDPPTIGRRDTAVSCTRCCSGDFCNRRCAQEDSPPYVILTPSINIAEAIPPRTNLTVLCRGEGSPSPSLLWEHLNSDQLNNIQANISDSGLLLSITNFWKQNEGYYHCKANNTYGQDVGTIYLTLDIDGNY